MDNVIEWQLWLLRNHWQDLRKAQHQSVMQKDVHHYIWGVLKRVHRMKKPEDKEKLMLHMIGDFKRFSLNPRSVAFRPTKKFTAKAKAMATSKAKAKAKSAP